MSAHAVSLHLEGPLYDYFRQRAQHKRHNLEAELLETVEAAGPKAQELPAALAQAVAELPGLDDAVRDEQKLHPSSAAPQSRGTGSLPVWLL